MDKTTESDFDIYKHNYVVWTASRALRPPIKTKYIEQAINESGIREFAICGDVKTASEYDILHEIWCDKILKRLNSFEVKRSYFYGVAAKIVAIYFKTTIILPERGETLRCRLIHPPVDSIVIESLRDKGYVIENMRWTTLSKKDYEQIVKEIRTKSDFNWIIEKEWKSTVTKKNVQNDLTEEIITN